MRPSCGEPQDPAALGRAAQYIGDAAMIYAPFTLVLLFLLLALLSVFLVLVEMRVLAYAYRKVGVRPRYAFAVMLLSLLGSHVNVPLYAVSGQRVLRPHELSRFGRTYMVPESVEPGATVVALNVGGALIPILVSIYLVGRTRLYGRMAIGVAIFTTVVHSLAQTVPGWDIAVPLSRASADVALPDQALVAEVVADPGLRP